MKTYDFRLVDEKSRFFDQSHPDDADAILVNQAAVSEYEIEDPFNTVIFETNLRRRYKQNEDHRDS